MTQFSATALNRRAATYVLRAEGAAAFAAALVAYSWLGGSWSLFALLFLLPDAGMLGYLANPRVGAAAYNMLHTYVGPMALGAIGIAAAPALLPVALIWTAHIGFDRMLGYGLKYADAFGATHLGWRGRPAPGPR